MPSTGDKIVASDVNSLFSRLNQIRIEHNNTYQPTEVQQELNQEFNTEPAVAGTKAKADGTIPLMKQYINTLRKSVFLTAITDEQVDSITVPNVADLMKYEEYGEADQLIALIETYPSTYTTNFSGFNSGNFGFNGSDFRNFSFHSGNFRFNGSDFRNFSFHSGNFRFNGSDFRNFSFHSGNFNFSSPSTPHTNQRFDGRFFNN